MSQNNLSWDDRLTANIFTNITSARKARGLSAQALSNACDDLGYPIDRRVLSKMDNHARSNITVPEAIVIAEALGVGLADLIAGGENVEFLPGRFKSPAEVADAVSGQSRRLNAARQAIMDAVRKLDAKAF